VYERLGDVQSRAVTLGKVADILAARGDLDEALRIRREEELPVYERLGDVRSRAVTLGQVADILAARGDLDEALRIRREEELPVYERLGDVRSRAVTLGKVADILAARGDLDEALRIRREDLLPVFERLGARPVFERAVTLGKVADILAARGRPRRSPAHPGARTVLPVFERLGDVRSRAVTLGKVADILAARGDLDEALRILREEELPGLRAAGGRPVARGHAGEGRRHPGGPGRPRRSPAHPPRGPAPGLRAAGGRPVERAVTLGKVADILAARGDLDEALRILREEELPVYERLGGARSHGRPGEPWAPARATRSTCRPG
jgi:tetratricopeptide (TPR) repeat protein